MYLIENVFCSTCSVDVQRRFSFFFTVNLKPLSAEHAHQEVTWPRESHDITLTELCCLKVAVLHLTCRLHAPPCLLLRCQQWPLKRSLWGGTELLRLAPPTRRASRWQEERLVETNCFLLGKGNTFKKSLVYIYISENVKL